MKTPVLTALVVASMAWCGLAGAADAPAAEDNRPNVALAACASGDVSKGIAILGELYAETRNPAYVFNQGRCYQKNAKLEQARGSFLEYLRLGTDEPPEDIQRAKGFVKEIDETLAPQRAAAVAPATVIVTPAAPSEDGRRRSLRVTSVVLAGVGVAAVAAGVYLSLKVKQANDDINREFAGKDYVTDTARLQQQISDGQRYETWQWVGYGVGVAAMAGAVTTLVLSGAFGRSSSATADHAMVTMAPALSPDGAGGVLRVRF
jgi:hypothetical protein